MSLHLSRAQWIPLAPESEDGKFECDTIENTLWFIVMPPTPSLGKRLASSSPAELHGVLSGDPGQPVVNLSWPVAGPSFLPFNEHTGRCWLSLLRPVFSQPLLANFRPFHKRGVSVNEQDFPR